MSQKIEKVKNKIIKMIKVSTNINNKMTKMHYFKTK